MARRSSRSTEGRTNGRAFVAGEASAEAPQSLGWAAVIVAALSVINGGSYGLTLTAAHDDMDRRRDEHSR